MLTLQAKEKIIENLTPEKEFVRGTVGAICQVSFDEFWQDCEKTVVFKRDNREAINIIVNSLSNEVEIPPEILDESGKFRVGVFGITENKVLPTLWSDDIKILYGTDTHGTTPPKYTPNEIDQLRMSKQDKLIAGDNITIENNVISSPGGGGNIRNGTGSSSLQQIQDRKYTGVAIVTKNPNAAALDSTLTDNEPIGATGEFATAFGGNTSAQGKRAMAQGTNTVAKGKYSLATGDNSVTLGNDSLAHGNTTTTVGMASTAGGFNTVSQGDYSDAGGHSTKATGKASVSRGYMTVASGDYSFVTGANTIASGENQTVVGQFNIEDENALFIVGNGTNAYNRSNVFAVYKDGSIKIGNTTVTESQLKKLLALIG